MFLFIKKHVVHATCLVRHAIKDRLNPEKRSSRWPAVKNAHIRANPYCAGCRATSNLNVHHKKPFHLHPKLELDDRNLITLCMSIDRHCHLLVGHGNNFKAFNPTVVEDCALLRSAYERGDVGLVKDLQARIKKERKFELPKHVASVKG